MGIKKPLLFIFLYLLIAVCAFFIYKLTIPSFKNQSVFLKKSTIVKNSSEESVLYNTLLREYPRLYKKNIHKQKGTILKSDKYGYIATDGYSVTHRYDDKTKKMVHLDKYELLDVEPKKRIVNQLNMLRSSSISNTVNGKKELISNPFKINKTDIEKYDKSINTYTFKSFRIITNRDNNPILIFTTTGIPKNELDATFLTINKAIKNLEESNPGLLDIITRQYLLRVLSGNIVPEQLTNLRTMAISRLGAVVFRTTGIGNDSLFYAYSIANLSRYIGSYRSYVNRDEGEETFYIDNKFDNDPIIDRKLWTLQWLKSHKDNLFKEDYNGYVNLTNSIK